MEFQSCAVCKRSILRGEQPAEYVDDEGVTVVVCPLCRERAEQSGWVAAELAATAPAPAPRRRRGAGALRERLSRVRLSVAIEPADAEAETGEPAAREPAAPPAAPPQPLEVFNASSEAHKVAGLRRSLGEPRVCLRDEERGGGLVVVVAWDLSWYRWIVTGDAVRQLAKGNEISELPLVDRDWNATALDDGTLVRA